MLTTTAAQDATAALQSRARRLRDRAALANPVLAATYRRRATELDVQAWLEAVWNPPIDLDDCLDPYCAA
jgi:hypothetical protein